MGGNRNGAWQRAAGVSVGGALALTCLAAAATTLEATPVNTSPAAAVPVAAPSPLTACDGPFATVLQQAAVTDARAYWLSRQLIKWPGAGAAGASFKLYYSASAQLQATAGSRVSGADGSLALSRFDGTTPADIAQRFKFVGDGALLSVASADAPRLPGVLTQQVMIVLEAEDGTVRDATTLQIAGALDDLYAGAASASDLGVTIAAGRAGANPAAAGKASASTGFKLWAPTAQRVALCTYASGAAKAAAIMPMQRDDATGIWSAHLDGDRSGAYYQYLVDVVAPGAGLVRNLVTDPYSVSLTTDSKRSYIADLNAANLKPAGWDKDKAPEQGRRADRHVGLRTARARLLHQRQHRQRRPTAANTPPSPKPIQRHEAPRRAEQGRHDRHSPAARLRHRQRAGKRLRHAEPSARPGTGQRRGAGAGRKRPGHRLLQLGLRPVPLQRAGRQLRHRSGRWRQAHHRIPPDGAGAAQDRPARGHGRGLQPYLHRRPE
jgi:hypothetical protein